MKIHHYEQVESETVTMQGAAGCQVRWLIGKKDGAPTFAMRQFEVAPGGYTPRHYHPYEHEVFVLEGEGKVFAENAWHPLHAGDILLIKPDEVHQFKSDSDTPLKFLCLVPNSAASGQVTVVPEQETNPTGDPS